MIAGIDIGGTNTHGVLIKDKRLKASVSVPGNKISHIKKCYRLLRKEAGKAELRFVLTGGGARRLKKASLYHWNRFRMKSMDTARMDVTMRLKRVSGAI